jgi:hypothetical protein
VVGNADYQRKEIRTFRGSQAFLDSVLPHELTHLVFRDFVGFTADVPLWLDEGVSQWQDVAARGKAHDTVLRLLARGQLIPLERLTRMTAADLGGWRGPARFYAQAVSVVGYLTEVHGTTRFTKFCRQLRDGKSLGEALRFTYPENLGNIGALESSWLKYLKQLAEEKQK